jgi:hypothetical protein
MRMRRSAVRGQPRAHPCHVRAATVYKLCAVGKLGHVRILNAIRVTHRDLDALIAKGGVFDPTGEP